MGGAATYLSMPLAEQSRSSDAVFEAVVDEVTLDSIEGTFPVMRVTAHLGATFRAAGSDPELQLLFPGGVVGDTWLHFGVPRPGPGDRLLMFATRLDDGVFIMRNGPSSLVLHRDGLAVDADNNPIVDLSCDGASIVARPLSEQPAQPADSASPSSQQGPVQGARIFVDDPDEHGQSWEDALSVVAACVDANPLVVGSEVAP